MKKQNDDLKKQSGFPRRRHSFAVFVIICLALGAIAPIVVNLCYQSSTKWIITEWTAADMLSYIAEMSGAMGTIILGVVTLWQTKEIEKENTLSQERLERISKHANELNIINKIIEFEANRLETLNSAYYTFVSTCDANAIVAIIDNHTLNSTDASSKDFIAPCRPALTRLHRECDNGYKIIKEKLKLDTSFSDEFLIESLDRMKDIFRQDLINPMLKNNLNRQESYQLIRAHAEPLQKANKTFVQAYETYLANCHQRLNRALFEDMSLMETKALFIKQNNQ